MIVSAALCPHPPLLLRELTGRQDVAAELRADCVAAVRDATLPAEGVAAGPAADVVVVVGGADVDAPRAWDPAAPVQVRRFGTTGPAEPAAGGPGLPLSLGVGSRLLELAGWTGPVEPLGVPWSLTPAQAVELADELAVRPERVALLVLGEGSARRGEKAPGFLDDRAFPYDDALAAAVAAGDARALLDLDPDLAEELMVLGRAAFAVLGAAGLAASPDRAAPGPAELCELRRREDPHGVTYLVGLWSFR